MNILIIGGGFVGITTARQLSKQFGGSAKITLISSSDHFLFTPRLIDMLAATSETADRYTTPIEAIARKHQFNVLRADVLSIDRDKKTLTCKHNASSVQTTLSYDTLVICPGAHTSWFHIPGAEEHSFPLKTVQDVRAIHARIHALLDEGVDIHACVIGGGPTGTEAVFALQQYIQAIHRERSSSQRCTFKLIQGASQILPGFPLRIVTSVMQDCAKQNIEVITNEPVTRVSADHITTSHHEHIPANLILWAGGLAPNSIPIFPPLHTDQSGWLIADHHLCVGPDLFAAGDIVTYAERNVTIPRNAQTAMLMAYTLAKNVIRHQQGTPLVPFHYHSRGNMLIVGNTGYLDVKLFSIRTKYAPLIRDLLYRLRQKQITGL